MRRKLNREALAGTTGKVLKFLPICCTKFTPRYITYVHQMSSKLNTITTKLNESKIIGREGDKEELQGKLLGNDEVVSILSIVGMGGIGKTTLAKVLYKEIVKNHFEFRTWVCVSRELKVFNISKPIFQEVTPTNGDFANLEPPHVTLKEKHSKNRFQLVLDDVWNKDQSKWELLKNPLLLGVTGSRVIVDHWRTRVASVMGSNE